MNSLKIQPTDRILIISPHPDDETIGCGGLLVKYGPQCDVVLITDGRYGFMENSTVKDPNQIAIIRRNEFKLAMESVGVNRTECLDLPNENLKPYIRSIKKIDFKDYTKIFIPGAQDHHHEHILINRYIRRMVKTQWCKSAIFEYEVWTPITDPDYILDISDVIDEKSAVLSLYQSQMECYDYLNISRSLNMYRGCTHLTEYAEMYKHRETIRSELKKSLRRIKKAIPHGRK